MLIIIHLIQIVLSNNNLIVSKFSYITLKINGIENKNVFSSPDDFNSKYYPNIIHIKGIKQSTMAYSYYFNKTDNFVNLILNNSINYCYGSFLIIRILLKLIHLI